MICGQPRGGTSLRVCMHIPRWAVIRVLMIRTVFHSLGARSVSLILQRGSSLKRRRHVNVKQRVAVSARDA